MGNISLSAFLKEKSQVAISHFFPFFCLILHQLSVLFDLLTILAKALMKLSINANIVVGDFGTQLSDNRLYPLNHFVE